MFSCIELCAGAGGLALGFENAGFHHSLLVEIDKDCVATLNRNRPNWNVLHEDIQNVDFSNYEADIVVAGLPCQPYSYAGKKLGLEDTRGTLFYDYARCLQEVKPPMFIIENVQGLVHHDKGRTLNTMLAVLKDELGYNVQWKVLNSNDYGVAQKRKRTFVVGVKDGYNFEYPKPFDYKPVLRDALKDVPESEGTEYSEKKKEVMDLVPPGGCWVDLPEDIQKEYMGRSYYSGGGRRGMARRISWDEPCLTLTTSPCQKQTERCHPSETRPFTVREYARIQSFPDDWEFEGGITSKYKQIGNAVPVLLAAEVGKQAIKCLQNPNAKTEKQTKLI